MFFRHEGPHCGEGGREANPTQKSVAWYSSAGNALRKERKSQESSKTRPVGTTRTRLPEEVILRDRPYWLARRDGRRTNGQKEKCLKRQGSLKDQAVFEKLQIDGR